MKNAFVISSLIFPVGYLVASIAETLGLVLFPVPSPFEFVGACTALGILAFAFRDYVICPRSRTLELRPGDAQSASLPTFVQASGIRQPLPPPAGPGLTHA